MSKKKDNEKLAQAFLKEQSRRDLSEISRLKAALKKPRSRKKRAHSSPFESALKGRFGKNAFDLAVDRFGYDIADRAGEAYALGRIRAIDERVKKRESNIKKAIRAGLSYVDAARMIAVKRPRLKPRVSYEPIMRGKLKGKVQKIELYDRVVKGKSKILRKKKILSAAAANREYSKQRTARYLEDLSTGLDVSMTEAREIRSEVVNKARRALADFKKTAKYRNLSARQKRRYTIKRWVRSNLSALAALADLEGSDYASLTP